MASLTPTISIITPSFNQGKFISATIESVLGQSVPELEYLVVDGGSQDETLAVLRDYESRLQWISEPDQGQTDALNKGLAATSGEIIGWLNSDDLYLPGALAKVLEIFRCRPEIEVLYGEADHIDSEGRIIDPYPTEPWNYQRLREVCFICQPALFFRRRILARAGLPDVRLQYCMDYEFWLRLGRLTPFLYVREKLAASRLYPENKTLGARLAVHTEINDMFRERLGRIPDKWIFNYAHAVADQHGWNREQTPENRRYVRCLVGETLKACWRWRQPLSPSGWRTLAGWLHNFII
jgi:glycosyltransferase involved in cell wall biosynthesis